LKSNAPNAIDEAIVAEFHCALEHLREAGTDIEEFRIAQELLKASTLSDSRFVDRSLFMIRVDAVLNYAHKMSIPQEGGGKFGRGFFPSTSATVPTPASPPPVAARIPQASPRSGR
jgi:hypothetical protein